VELGTAREVVSRQLKEFERRGWVALHRGRIDVVDADALDDLLNKQAL
jgi:CRP/FNR family transcriptional regulator